MEKNQEEKILNAAYDCIAGDGYAQVSLRQIAKKAGVAVSQISYHYRNKEGLLLAVVARTAKNYHAYLQDYLRPDMTPREKGDTFIRLYQRLLEEDVQLFRVLYDMVGLALWSEPFRLEVREIFRGITEQITAEVFTDELMAELGYVHNPETLASLFFGGLFGIALQALLEPENEAISGSLSALVVVFK
ncbi:MAG TPA: TetR/AcrR family transcriptional regulator [Firmicutes bacterium]|nr:TetR/AcrR family transcriptional regulator [Bacillota bacterium]